MFAKILTLLTVTILLLDPALPSKTKQANHELLAQEAVATACIGPMTLQIAPKDRGLILIAFGANGCFHEQAKNWFGLRFGAIVSPINNQSHQIPSRIISRI